MPVAPVPRAYVMVWVFVVHTAYRVMSEVIVKVLVAARAVPLQVAPGIG